MKDIRLYTKSDLQNFSAQVLQNFDGEIPISSLRVNSFLHNKNIDDTDIVLIAYFKDHKFAAYFGFIPDFFSDGEKFYWNSGWRANENIDKRAANIVFYKALSLYGNNLILNHLTPHTRKVLNSTNIFEQVKELKGKKFFLKSPINEILLSKNKKLKSISSIFSFSDRLINWVFTNNNNAKNYINKIEILPKIDADCERFINSTKKEFIKDNVYNINHALAYKWLTNSNLYQIEAEKYYFSLIENVFENYIIKITDNEEIIGVFHIVNRNYNFKLYFSYFNSKLSNSIAKDLRLFLQKNNAKTFLSFDTILNSELSKFQFLFTKKTLQYYTYSKQISKHINSEQKFQAGFGDVLYT